MSDGSAEQAHGVVVAARQWIDGADLLTIDYRPDGRQVVDGRAGRDDVAVHGHDLGNPVVLAESIEIGRLTGTDLGGDAIGDLRHPLLEVAHQFTPVVDDEAPADGDEHDDDRRRRDQGDAPADRGRKQRHGTSTR